MKSIKGWWFAPKNNKLANGDGRRIKVGVTHKINGKIIPCQHGLHLSPKILDALSYSPGPIIYKVEGYGKIIPHGDPVDKYVCSQRTYIAGGIDISDILRKFAQLCALDVVKLWDAPPVVVEYLKTGKEELRAASASAARDAAWAAARDAASAASWDASWAASASAPWDASWAASASAARDAAWDAAWAASASAARAAAWDVSWAAWDAAWDESVKKQNKRLTNMVNRVIK